MNDCEMIVKSSKIDKDSCWDYLKLLSGIMVNNAWDYTSIPYTEIWLKIIMIFYDKAYNKISYELK